MFKIMYAASRPMKRFINSKLANIDKMEPIRPETANQRGTNLLAPDFHL
ncbi:hypothetical protein [Gracilibacillus thailandensis]|nr:hypothetical protein [Gracilibacillus thailandensis]